MDGILVAMGHTDSMEKLLPEDLEQPMATLILVDRSSHKTDNMLKQNELRQLVPFIPKLDQGTFHHFVADSVDERPSTPTFDYGK